MEDALKTIIALEKLNAELRADIAKYKELRDLDIVTIKALRDDARFGEKCRMHVRAMLELRKRGAPGFIDMCAPVLVRLLNSIEPMEEKP